MYYQSDFKMSFPFSFEWSLTDDGKQGWDEFTGHPPHWHVQAH